MHGKGIFHLKPRQTAAPLTSFSGTLLSGDVVLKQYVSAGLVASSSKTAVLMATTSTVDLMIYINYKLLLKTIEHEMKCSYRYM